MDDFGNFQKVTNFQNKIQPRKKPTVNIWSHLYDTLEPVFIQSQLLGFITFKYERNGVSLAKFKYLCSIILIVAFAILTVCILLNLSIHNSYSSIHTTTIIIQAVSALSFLKVTWICAIFTQKSHLQIINEIIDYDTKFMTHGEINYDIVKKKMIYSLIFRHLLTVVVYIFLILQNFVHSKDSPINNGVISINIIFYTTFFINPALHHQIVSYIYLVNYRIRLLNNELRNNVLNTQKKTFNNKVNAISNQETEKSDNDLKSNVFSDIQLLKSLKNVSFFHHHLSKIVKQINKVFGIPLLLSFNVSFVSIVSGLYGCHLLFTGVTRFWLIFVNHGLMSISCIVDVLIVCTACQRTIEQMKKSGILIHQIVSQSEDVRDEMEMFSLQLANENVEFNAAGFFTIDYTLIFTIIGGVTTYIIILIQLSG